MSHRNRYSKLHSGSIITCPCFANVDIYTVGDQYATLSYGYNDKGYITSRGDLNIAKYESYTYDALGRLTQVSDDGV